MLCCINCFNDDELKYFIKTHPTTKRTNCDYCFSKNIQSIKPNLLLNQFEFLISNVKISKSHNSMTLDNLLQNHFYIFNSDIRNKNRLLTAILGKNYQNAKYEWHKEIGVYKDAWSKFKNEIKFTNRFFPKNIIYSSVFKTNKPKDQFFEMLEQLTVNVENSADLYRARISDHHIESKDMGAPPAGIASGGRANPIGIPYLYLANNIATCIAEVRPNNTSTIYISRFHLKNKDRELRVLDLTKPRKKISILKLSNDASNLASILEYLQLLEILSIELSTPISPYSSSLDYIPTQILSEFIKTIGEVDGIKFNSSFGQGVNYVFYDTSLFNIEKPQVYKINNIRYHYNVID